MTEYHVSYSIDIDEESPLEAARWLATRLETHGYASRGVYEVFPHDGGDGVQVDLSGELEDQVLTPSPRIEVLVVRDPDGPAEVRVFVDGVETNAYTEEVVDAGAGHMLSEWVTETRTIATSEDRSPAFRTAVVIAREDPPGSNYIEDDRTPSRDLVWNVHRDNELFALWEDYPNLHENEKDRLDYFACEQVSRLLVTKLREAGWDAWLMHGTDPESVDGLLGDHYWVAVDDGGMTEHIDATYKQFHNVADPAIALAVDAAAGEWPLQWHTYAESPRHQVVPYRTITAIKD